MIPKKLRHLGFTLSEMAIVLAVFSMTALGIFIFFQSQSEDIRVKNAIARVNRTGQSLSEMIRDDLSDVDGWAEADVSTMSFITHGEKVTYHWDALTGIFSRNGVEIARNIEGVEFHYYPAFISTSEAQPGPRELPKPIPYCPALDSGNCSMNLANIRGVDARFTVESRSREFSESARYGNVAPQHLITPEAASGVRVKRQFTVRVNTKNLFQPTSDISVENYCGKISLSHAGASEIASCDADGEAATIQVSLIAPGGAEVFESSGANPVKIRAVYMYNTDTMPQNKCPDAACAGQMNSDEFVEDPIIDTPELTSSASVKISSPADQAGNKILVFAQWTPPANRQCTSPQLMRSNPLVVTVKAGAPYKLKTAGLAERSSVMLGADTETAMNSCGGSAGCDNTGTTLKVQLLDKCGNPVSNNAGAVQFTINHSDPDNRLGSFNRADPASKTITLSKSDNGVYAASIFSGANMPPRGYIPVRVELLGNPAVAGDIRVPVKSCDIPYKIELINPTSGVLPKDRVIPACPGRSEAISFQILNACGDPIAMSNDPALSTANPDNWSIWIDSKLSKTDEEKQVGTLGPVAGGKVVPSISKDNFLIEYRTGGTGIEASRLDSSYCGAARSGVPVVIKFNPLPDSTGKKTVLLNLGACPALSAQLFIDNRLNLPVCDDASSAQMPCFQPDGPEGGVEDDFILRTQILSCPQPGKAALPLKNVGALFVSENQKDPSQHPFFSESGDKRSYFVSFPDDYEAGSGEMMVHLNSGRLALPTSLKSKIAVKTILCLPGKNSVLDTLPDAQSCSGDDNEFTSNPLYFTVGPSPSDNALLEHGDEPTGEQDVIHESSKAILDVSPPDISLKKVSRNLPSGPALPNWSRVKGMLYLQGEAFDQGAVAAINISLDGGLTYIYNGSYDSATGKWAAAIDTNELPDGMYNIAVRAFDSSGNAAMARTDDGSQEFPIIVDKYPESLVIFGNSGEICGNHTFIADVSGFAAKYPAGTAVKFYIDGGTTPIAESSPDENLLARATIDVNGFSGHSSIHILHAVAASTDDPSVTVGASQEFIVNDSVPLVSLEIPSYDGLNPLQGTIEARVRAQSCNAVTAVRVESYLTGNTAIRSAPAKASFVRCLVSSTPDGTCRDGEWVAFLDTNPSSCKWSDGFTGNGQNAFHAIVTDSAGRAGTTSSEPAYPVDNTPSIKVKLPGNGTYSGQMNFEAEVSDCNGVPKDKLALTIPRLGVFDMTRKGGSDTNGIYNLTLNTSDYPACKYGLSYFPSGAYDFTIAIDDNAPGGSCPNPETRGDSVLCGKYSGSFRVENGPGDVAITSINGASPSNGQAVSGNYLFVECTAKSCDLKTGFGSVRLLVDGIIAGYMISGPGGQYSIRLPVKNATLLTGEHALMIEAVGGPGAPKKSAPINISVP